MEKQLLLLLITQVMHILYFALYYWGLKANTLFVLLYADCGPKEDGEAFVAEVWEICRQIHHHGKFLTLCLRPYCSSEWNCMDCWTSRKWNLVANGLWKLTEIMDGKWMGSSSRISVIFDFFPYSHSCSLSMNSTNGLTFFLYCLCLDVFVPGLTG